MKRTQIFPTRRNRLARRSVSLLLAASLLGASLLAAAGCGGGGSSNTGVPGTSVPAAATRGQVRFTIKWPERASATRLVPRAAESIKFTCLDADDEDELISEVVVPRGQSVATLDLPSVRVRINAEARSDASGGGQVLARGGITVQVKEAKVSAEQLTLDSVITDVKLDKPSVDLPGGTTDQVSAHAVDATGAMVLTAPENWEWTPDDASAAAEIVEYTPGGDRLNLRPLKDGTVAFTVKEKETGKTARLTVTSHAAPPDPGPGPVTGQPGLIVEPSSINLSAGDIIYPKAYWRDNDGNVMPINATFWSYSHVYQFYHMYDGTRPMLAMKQGEDILQVEANGRTVEVPVKVTGYILTVTVSPGDNGEMGEVEVYIDNDMVMKAAPGGNTLGWFAGGFQNNTIGIPLPINLTPGRHYFYAKGLSDKPVRFRAEIVGVASISGTVSKDSFVTDVFYKQ